MNIFSPVICKGELTYMTFLLKSGVNFLFSKFTFLFAIISIVKDLFFLLLLSLESSKRGSLKWHFFK